MSSLADFQYSMSAALRNSDGPCPIQVVQQGADQQSRRFDIYRNNRMVSLIDNLQAVYPTVCQLVGDEFFRAAAKLYIEQHPPASPVMAEYGGDFATFVGQFPTTQDIPWIVDMAHLEWARLCSYHSANAVSLTTDVLVSIPPDALETLCVVMHPSLRMVSSGWPVGSIWNAMMTGADESSVDMKNAENVVVVRPELDVCVQILPADGALLLNQLRQGVSLLVAVDHVTKKYPDFNPGTHLQGLFGLGAFKTTYQQGK